MDIDKSKENIQPLRGGRNVSQLGAALQAQSDMDAQRRLMTEKDEHEALIRNYNGPDPLDPWFSYIQWIEQCFPKHGHEGHIDKVIKDCLQKFEKDERYAQDRRFLKLWIKYIDCLSNPLEVYQLLYNHNIGTRCSELYRAWACYCQEANDYRQAMRVFEFGLDADAQPRDELEEAHINFQLFYARRMLLDDSPTRRRGDNNLAETRAALTSLRGVKRRGDSQPVRAPHIRIGKAILSSRPGVVPQSSSASHSSSVQSNIQLNVYQDTDNRSDHIQPSYPSVAISRQGSGLSLVDACSEEQNQREVGLWSGAQSTALVAGPKTSQTTPFSLYEDENIILSNNHKKYCLDDLSTFIIPVCNPDPDDNTKISHYNKKSVYIDNTEFSLEEIRSRRYLQRHEQKQKSKASESPMTTTAPSPVLLCNLDSQELTSHGDDNCPAVVNEYRDSLLANLHSDSLTVNTKELLRKAFNDDESVVQPIAQQYVPNFDILEEPTAELMMQNFKNKQSNIPNGVMAMDVAMDVNHMQPNANKENGPVRLAVHYPHLNNDTHLLNETTTQHFNFHIPIASTPNTAQFKKPPIHRHGHTGAISDGLSDIMETTEYKSSSSSSGVNTARTNTMLSNATDGRSSLSQQPLTPADFTSQGQRFQQQSHRTLHQSHQSIGSQLQNVNQQRNHVMKDQEIQNMQQQNHSATHHQHISHLQMQNPHSQQNHQFQNMTGQQNVHINQPIQNNRIIPNSNSTHNQHYTQNHLQQQNLLQHQQSIQQPMQQSSHQQQQIHDLNQLQHQQQVHLQQHQQTYNNWSYQVSVENYENVPQSPRQNVINSPQSSPSAPYQQIYQRSPQTQHSFSQAGYKSPNYQQYSQYQHQSQLMEKTQHFQPERSFNMYYQMKQQTAAPSDQTFGAYNNTVHLSFAQRSYQENHISPDQTTPALSHSQPTVPQAVKPLNPHPPVQIMPPQPTTPQPAIRQPTSITLEQNQDETSRDALMHSSHQIAQQNLPDMSPAARLRSVRPDSATRFSEQFLSFITSRTEPKDSESNSPNISQKMHKNLYVSSPEQSQMANSRPSSEHGFGSQPDLVQFSNSEKSNDLSKRQLDFDTKNELISDDSEDSLGKDSRVSSLESRQTPQSVQTFGDSENSMEYQAYTSICSNRTVETHEIPRPANIDFPKVIDPFNKTLCNSLLEYVKFPNKTHFEGCYEVKVVPKLQQGTVTNLGGCRYSVEKQLGNGTFGSVFRCVDLGTNVSVALKYQKPGHPWEFYICQEIKARVKDPFMLPGYIDITAAFLGDQASIFVSELSKYGSLLDVANKIKIATTKCIAEPIVMLLSCEILSIMHHLHKSQIIHADIKPDNFLLMQIPTIEWRSPSLQLIDLGCAIDMSLFPKGTAFTKEISTDGFTCGEMRQGKPWTYQTDLFCIAGTIHVLLFGSYMKTTVKNGKHGLEKKWPRYMKESMWEQLFSSLLNVKDCWSQPDLMELKTDVESAMREQESSLTSQLRTFANILKSR